MRARLWVLVIAALFVLVACQKKEPATTESEAPAEQTSEQAGEQTSPEQAAPADQQPGADQQPADTEQAGLDSFSAKFETTAGDFVVDVHPEWAPEGAKRFKELVEQGFYTDIAVFRVIDGFMAQFGIHGDPTVMAKWRDSKIPDDPRRPDVSNARGFVTFATAGPNTRTTQLFINYGNNAMLDSQGFTPFGKVAGDGMEVVEKFYKGYGEGAPRGRGPDQGRLQNQGNEYLKKEFPEMTYIKSITLIEQ